VANRQPSITLSAKQREGLRYAIRSHPDVLTQVERLSDIGSLNKRQLLAVAAALGVDAGSSEERSFHPSLESEEGWALMEYSEKNPAFSGVLEDTVTIVLFGQAITRRFRIAYDMTPEWPYFDLSQGKEMKGWEQSRMSFEICVKDEEVHFFTKNGKPISRRAKEKWVICMEFFGYEGIGHYLDERIDERIQEKCLRENGERRRAAKQMAAG